MTPPPVNYTTTIAAAKTIGELHALLAHNGARTIATRYTEGRADGLSFQLYTAHGLQTFVLPVDIPAMNDRLTKARRTNPRVKATPDQAERTAWRVIKDWVGAQLALIDAGQATPDQVMLPYLMVDRTSGETMFDAYCENAEAARTALPR